MNTKPFIWTVQYAISPVWVADGFVLDDDRAMSMLANELSYAHGGELFARVLHAPPPARIARAQGYGPKDGLPDDLKRPPHAGKIYSALVSTRNLLDSVAFAAREGDKNPVLARIDEAITLLTGSDIDEVASADLAQV